MKLYHLTTSANAESIRAHGFRDSERDGVRGVWFSDVPLWDGGPVDDVPDGWSIISINIADDLLAEFEVSIAADVPPTYREWCVPASVANREILARCKN